MLTSPECKDKFFKTHHVAGKEITIFNQGAFNFFINHYQFLPDSYTRFTQNIGLSLDGTKLLRQNRDVALIFPYKDCLLAGGQTKEESSRDEVFYNQVLAPNQIDRLLDKKVFRNFKRVGESEEPLQKIPPVTQQNLLIKGNNLLVLHSLKSLYRGKVKLIYIDPPYNTGGDANIFTYNNTFNHSTWLVFMKNRLQVAKEFLRDDGFIAIAIDHHELFYLGVLADEIFGRDNRLGVITVVHKPEGRSQEKFLGVSNEFMLVYAKNRTNADFNKVIISEHKRETFNLKDEYGKYKLRSFIRGEGLREEKPNLFYPIYVSSDLKDISLEDKEGYTKVLPVTNKERIWFLIKDSFLKKLNNNEIVVKKDDKNEVKIFYKVRETEVFTTHWIDTKYNATTHGIRLLEKILGYKPPFSYPKSLYTILDTLKIMTNKDDIILDFFAGSGTTGHAVLALNQEDGGTRRFILVEQLEEHIAVCTQRIQKVIAGYAQEKEEQKTAESHLNTTKSPPPTPTFIYCELAAYNQQFIPRIQQAQSTKELHTIYHDMQKNGLLSYQFNDKEFDSRHQDFETLPLADQKQILMHLLDKNMLYLNYDDIEDERYQVHPTTIKLNHDWYQSK